MNKNLSLRSSHLVPQNTLDIRELWLTCEFWQLFTALVSGPAFWFMSVFFDWLVYTCRAQEPHDRRFCSLCKTDRFGVRSTRRATFLSVFMEGLLGSPVFSKCVCACACVLKQDIESLVADCAVSRLFKVCHVMERKKVAWPVLTIEAMLTNEPFPC